MYNNFSGGHLPDRLRPHPAVRQLSVGKEVPGRLRLATVVRGGHQLLKLCIKMSALQAQAMT